MGSRSLRVGTFGPLFQQFLKCNHSEVQVCTFHDGCKQGIDQQIFNRKSISRKIGHRQYDRFWFFFGTKIMRTLRTFWKPTLSHLRQAAGIASNKM